MPTVRVPLYGTRNLATEVDPGARTVLPGTNVTFTTDPVSGTITINAPGALGGTVTSVGLAAPTGLTVSGSPVTTSGTLTLSYTAGYQGYTTTEASKLAGIAAGAQVNVATNLAQGTRTTTTVPVTSSTGTSATLGVATTSLAGVMSSADKTKLDGVEAGATAGATWGVNLASIPANITAWAAVAPASKADVASPVFTGNPTAPTPATADNDTSVATTAYVKAQGYATTVSLGSYVLKAGDTMFGGLSMGSGVAAAPTDLSRHLALFGTNYGFSITNLRMNYVVGPGAGHKFVVNGADLMSLDVTNGLSTAGINLVIASGDIYTYRAGGASGVLFLNNTGTRYLYYSGTHYEMPGATLNLDSGVQLGTGGKLLSKLSLGTAAPGALADGELYLRY